MTSEQPFAQRHPMLGEFLTSGLSVGTGVILTNPVDVVKIRQQLAGRGRNVFYTSFLVVRDEGPLALYRGVTAAVARGMLYGGLRIGLYNPMKRLLGAEGHESALLRKVAAGMLSGALAAGICNPTDLVKTRMQAKGATSRNPFAVAALVYREDGLKGLWRGTTPSMARAALLTAAQLATYDEVKHLFIRQLGWEDSMGTHFTVSAVAGLVTTTVTAPVDMVKTHMFVNGSKYASPLDCMVGIYKRHGLRGFFRG
ncbi:hypothetical protein N2152v2_010149 [Parachlorella kessleri]